MAESPKSVAFWRSFPIFEEFTPALIEEVRSLAQQRKWTAGAVIFQRGDPGDYMILVASGRIKLSLITPQGRELTLRHMEEGGLLGEMAVIDGEPRSADATASVATEGYVISKNDFSAFLAKTPAAMQAVMRFLCRRLRETNEQLETLALYDLDSRVARFFLLTMRQVLGEEPPEEAVLKIGLSQSEIASVVGASRPKINRAILSLEEKGAIERKGASILLRTRKLRAVAEPDED